VQTFLSANNLVSADRNICTSSDLPNTVSGVVAAKDVFAQLKIGADQLPAKKTRRKHLLSGERPQLDEQCMRSAFVIFVRI